MTEELKPCPFCGASVELHELAGFSYVRCSRLECQGSGDWSDSSAIKVAATWNTRPVEDALRARVAELEAERDWLSSIVENVEMTELVFAVDKAKALGAQEPPHAAQESQHT